MLDVKELDAAISELEAGKVSLSGCAKLADLYTVRDHISARGGEASAPAAFDAPRAFWGASSMTGHPPGERGYYASGAYSSASGAARHDTVPDGGGLSRSAFLAAAARKDAASVWDVLDELMDTLHVVNPRVYDSVMRKIEKL